MNNGCEKVYPNEWSVLFHLASSSWHIDADGNTYLAVGNNGRMIPDDNKIKEPVLSEESRTNMIPYAHGAISQEDHMGILALELKKALELKPEPQVEPQPNRAPRVHGIGTVAPMSCRLGAGFGSDPT